MCYFNRYFQILQVFFNRLEFEGMKVPRRNGDSLEPGNPLRRGYQRVKTGNIELLGVQNRVELVIDQGVQPGLLILVLKAAMALHKQVTAHQVIGPLSGPKP
jgi:hypothetical protein